MSDYTILISATEGGLAAVANQAGCTIVPNTTKQFDTITTYQDVPMSQAGVVRSEDSGWIALGII